MKEQDLWSETEKVFQKIKKKWDGVDIPIFIFPMDETNRGLMRDGKGKSGVAFRNMLFLFLNADMDYHELEALFVHEYHHVCRMNHQKKNPSDYTLLDSIILEGLAENAVLEMCGDEYTNDWSKKYSKKFLVDYWRKEMKENLLAKRSDPLHDQILFGTRFRPKLIGYATGFEMVQSYKKHTPLSLKKSFAIPADKFLVEDFK